MSVQRAVAACMKPCGWLWAAAVMCAASAFSDSPRSGAGVSPGPLANLLASQDSGSRLRGYSIAEARSSLEPDEIRALIQSLRFQDDLVVEKHSRFGPSTEANRVTRVLVKHPQDSFTPLVDALEDPDWNVRRHAAFALGLVCNRDALAPLRSAIHREVERARHSTLVDAGVRSPFLAVLFSMVRAQAKLDPDEAFNDSLALFASGRKDVGNLFGNEMLGEFVRATSISCLLDQGKESFDCREEWRAEWQRYRNKLPNERFHVEICSPWVRPFKNVAQTRGMRPLTSR